MTKQRLVFLSNIAAPYQVKFCEALQPYYDTEFWFYEQLTDRRPDWWAVPLGPHCKILKGSVYSNRFDYSSLDVFVQLIRFRPHILMLGGFSVFHFLLLHLGKLFGIRVVFLSEPLRNVSHEDAGETLLWTKENPSRKVKWMHRLFKKADLIFGMGEVAKNQFIEEIGFAEHQVVSAPYPIDIEAHIEHPLRQKKQHDPIQILFANRLIDRYQPLVALEAYKTLKAEYPHLSLAMNQEGHLAEACQRYIEKEHLEDVFFLEDIESWDSLHKVYQAADILVLPATYSNGNLTIVEACASGMGIVVSHEVNNVARHLHENVNCYKCDSTAESLATQLRQYLDHPERLTEHGKRSKELVDHRLNANTAKTYAELLYPFNRKGDANHAQTHVTRRGNASSSGHSQS